MASGRVTGAIDLRRTGGQLAGATRGAKAIGDLLDTLGKNEQKRQERKALDRVASMIASGKDDTESIRTAANQPATFDTGLAGFIQKLGVGNQSSPGGVGTGVNRSIINDALNRAQSGLTAEEQAQAARVKARIVPPATTPTAKAREPQIAQENDKTGLTPGTVYQFGPQNRLNVISKPSDTEPETLTFDERRRRDLQEAGFIEKEISELERSNTETQIAKNRAELEKMKAGPSGKLTGDDRVKTSSILRKEFDGLSKDFVKIRDSFERVKAAASDPSAAGDLAIIFNFMKILDPGSVVRESEFATAENAAGIPDKLRNLWNKALSGERITFNRDDFVNQAGNLFESQATQQSKLIERYSNLASEFGVERSDVVSELDKLEEKQKKTESTTEDIKSKVKEALGLDNDNASQSIMTAINPETNERRQSTDGGQTWQPIQ